MQRRIIWRLRTSRSLKPYNYQGLGVLEDASTYKHVVFLFLIGLGIRKHKQKHVVSLFCLVSKGLVNIWRRRRRRQR